MMDREEMLFCVIWGLNFFDLDLVFFVESKGKQNDMENAACRYGALPGYRTLFFACSSACLSNDFSAGGRFGRCDFQ